ncbi:MAG TPA: metallophosphoesterase family protein [Labilithrix sp.]|jgi:hypothetical protein|nr:metallophosphoesterase family protein [Labilithrix sp.]
MRIESVLRITSLLALVVACTNVQTITAPDNTTPPPPPDAEQPEETPPEETPPAVNPAGVDPVDAPSSGPWTPPKETGAVTFPYTAYRCGYAIRQVSPAKPTAIFHEDAAGSDAAPKNLHLTIAGNAATSVVVSWSTDDATKQTEVRFGDSPDALDKIAHGFSFKAGTRRQHEAHLCGLPPGKTFYYDAGGDAARSKVHKVTTAPDGTGEVTILVGGDMRSSPSIWGSMATSALAHGPTVMFLSGDAVASGGKQDEWDALFEAAPDLFAELPAVWAHGNHEALHELYFQQLALPDNGGTARYVEQWYARTFGPLRLVVLNDTVSSSKLLGGAEKQFLETTLGAVDRTRTPFVVTMHHKPMYTTSANHASDLELRAEWGPLLAGHQVDWDIAGHVHSYESTEPIKAGTTTVVAESEGGTRFFNFGGGGAPLYDFSAQASWLRKREKTTGYAIVKVDATTMTWSAFRSDGSAIETLEKSRR